MNDQLRKFVVTLAVAAAFVAAQLPWALSYRRHRAGGGGRMTWLLTAACVVGLVYWLSWQVLRDDLAPGPPPSPTGPVERCDLTPLIERADAAGQRDLALVLKGVSLAMDDGPGAMGELLDAMEAFARHRLDALTAFDVLRN